MFIVFEGIDGSGKTTQVKLLSQKLDRLKIKHILTSEPSSGAIGQFIRSKEKEYSHKSSRDMTSAAWQMLFWADRIDNYESTINPALEAGKIVICDRYFLSCFSYGGYGVSNNIPNILDGFKSHLKKPDQTFWIDIPVETALARIIERDGKILPHRDNRLDNVRLKYKAAYEDDGLREYFGDIIRIDGSKDKEGVHADIYKFF